MQIKKEDIMTKEISVMREESLARKNRNCAAYAIRKDTQIPYSVERLNTNISRNRKDKEIQGTEDLHGAFIRKDSGDKNKRTNLQGIIEADRKSFKELQTNLRKKLNEQTNSRTDIDHSTNEVLNDG